MSSMRPIIGGEFGPGLSPLMNRAQPALKGPTLLEARTSREEKRNP